MQTEPDHTMLPTGNVHTYICYAYNFHGSLTSV